MIKELIPALGIGIRLNPEYLDISETLQIIWVQRGAISPQTALFSFVFVCMFFMCLKLLRGVPWHTVFFALALILGSLNRVKQLNLETFGAELVRDVNFQTSIDELIQLHFHKVGLFALKKPIGLQFFLNCLFLSLITVVESSITVRMAQTLTKEKVSTKLQLYTVAMTNVLSGCLGLLPVTLPLARNLFTLSAGAKSRIYTMLCFIFTVTLMWAFWNFFLSIPVIVKTVFKITFGLLIIDLPVIRTYFKRHRGTFFCIAAFVFCQFFMHLLFVLLFFGFGFFVYYNQNIEGAGYEVGCFHHLSQKQRLHAFSMQLPDQNLCALLQLKKCVYEMRSRT